MPITSSAKRALRVASRRRVYNLRRSRAMQYTLQEVREAVQSGKKIQEAANMAYQAIDKAAKRGVIKKSAAARKKSQVAKLIGKKK